MKYIISPSVAIHKQITSLCLLGLLLAISMFSPLLAVAGVALDCEGSAQAYRLQGIPCDCVNGQIVCDQSSGKSSKKSANKSSSSSANNAIKLQVFQSVLDAVFLGPQDNASSQERQESIAALTWPISSRSTAPIMGYVIKPAASAGS
ncbi:MAG: hypothetical protein PHH28_02465 [Desulfuromonadaceae bacterium]|nr:hypothetical protein [Desulfuromonadaceae bacterium]